MSGSPKHEHIMIFFIEKPSRTIYGVQAAHALSKEDISKLNWLFGNARLMEETAIERTFIGLRAAMVTPWGTNAVEITQNMAIEGIQRIEEFYPVDADFADFDPMISQKYKALDQ